MCEISRDTSHMGLEGPWKTCNVTPDITRPALYFYRTSSHIVLCWTIQKKYPQNKEFYAAFKSVETVAKISPGEDYNKKWWNKKWRKIRFLCL